LTRSLFDFILALTLYQFKIYFLLVLRAPQHRWEWLSGRMRMRLRIIRIWPLVYAYTNAPKRC